MNLDATIQAFAQIPSGEGGDAVAQFQLLQSVEQALAKAHPKVINRVVSSMETAFVPVIIGGTTPPVRRAVLGSWLSQPIWLPVPPGATPALADH